MRACSRSHQSRGAPTACCQRKQDSGAGFALVSSIIWPCGSLSVSWTNAFGGGAGSLVSFKPRCRCSSFPPHRKYQIENSLIQKLDGLPANVACRIQDFFTHPHPFLGHPPFSTHRSPPISCGAPCSPSVGPLFLQLFSFFLLFWSSQLPRPPPPSTSTSNKLQDSGLLLQQGGLFVQQTYVGTTRDFMHS